MSTKAILAVVVALSTIVAVITWWLVFEDPIVWAYFLMLTVVGGSLLRVSSRERSSLPGLVLTLVGLAVLAYGVSFWNVVAAATAVTQLAWLIPPDAGIRLGEGFTLAFYTDGYTYYVNTLGVLTGYLLFLVGLSLVEFETHRERHR